VEILNMMRFDVFIHKTFYLKHW